MNKKNPGNPEWSIQVIPSLTANAPDNGWLEYDEIFFWGPAMDGLFSGVNS